MGNKKGELSSSVSSWKTPWFIIFLFTFGITVVFFIILMIKVKGAIAEFSVDAKDRITIERLMGGPFCLAYEQEYPHITYRYVMDWDKFKDDLAFRNCFNTTLRTSEMKIKLEIIDSESRSVYSKNYDKEGPFTKQFLYSIVIMKDGERKRGKISFFFQ